MIDDIAGRLKDIADAWEIFYRKTEKKAVLIERGKVKNVAQEIEEGYAVRVIVGRKVGFATSPNVNEAFEKAVKVARVSGEELSSFPEGGYTAVDGIYDSRFNDVDAEWLMNAAEAMTSPCIAINANPAFGSIEVEKIVTAVKNSSGFEMEREETSCTAFLEAVCEDSSAYEYFQSRSMKLDFEYVGKTAAELAVESRNPAKLEKRKCSVVLSPLALNQLLSYTLYQAMSAENVLKGRSPLKLGEFYGELTVVDDATLPRGLNSVPFDDEGSKSIRKVIFDKGELKTFISDYRNSLLLGIEAGNGFRDEITSYPIITPSNVVLEFERSSDVEDGALIVHSLIGAHTANPISGDFSVECMNAFYNGEPVKAMLYGNIYEVLKKIECFGKDVKQVDFTVSPSVRFGEDAMSII
ncbi:TldD/PmbA family protein [Archaeoglobus veneficus]|uniref:Peptidase U62 modulator of DNA gyrase n=1 Tax=Archaeoglobus veneficus (strain DSM 11195 / SNP6) TaxID=693661 RepID=F2KP97_ARCVS|nr:TldD/PmbA family protein [Archaeoglobus veneficus]AEA47501.1 peptidase U62 modulator of DNA gyrase [Archaeoglobus veneficus SNP6]